MDCVVLGSAVASLALVIEGHAGLLFGKDSQENIAKWKNRIVPNEDGTLLAPERKVDNDSDEFEL